MPPGLASAVASMIGFRLRCVRGEALQQACFHRRGGSDRRNHLQEPVDIFCRFPQLIGAVGAASEDVLAEILLLSPFKSSKQVNLVSVF